MNITDYKKLATKCEKHIKKLAIALDGVIKAEAAGQESMVRSSVTRARTSLTDAVSCMEEAGDQELLAPLYRMDKALMHDKDGELVAEIERDLHEFRVVFDAKCHAVDTSAKEMSYSGNTLG